MNIIPGNAVFALDVRSQSNSLMAELRERIDKGFDSIKTLYDADLTWQWDDYTPAAEVSEEAMKIADEAIRAVIGDGNAVPPVDTTGADDFHFYTIKKPELKAAMLGIGADLSPGLHHPEMAFNHDALDIGARVLAETLRRS